MTSAKCLRSISQVHKDYVDSVFASRRSKDWDVFFPSS